MIINKSELCREGLTEGQKWMYGYEKMNELSQLCIDGSEFVCGRARAQNFLFRICIVFEKIKYDFIGYLENRKTFEGKFVRKW